MQIPKFKIDIVDSISDLQVNKLESNAKTFLSETNHYINKSKNSMISNKQYFPENTHFDTFDEYGKKIIEKINLYISDLVLKQIEEVKDKLRDSLVNFENLSIEQIETNIYNAKHEITKITYDNIALIDSYIESNMEDNLDEYFKDNKLDIDSRTKIDLRKNYCENIKSNLSQVKSEFVNTSRNEIENLYDKTLSTFKEQKTIDLENVKEEKEVLHVNNDGLTDKLSETENNQKLNVKLSNLNINLTELEKINILIGSFTNIKVTIIEDGIILARDEAGQELEVKQNDDVIAIYDNKQNKAPYAIKINKENNNISVKHDNDMIVYDSNSNDVRVTVANDSERNDYIFTYENDNIAAYRIINGEKLPVENINDLIYQLNNQGINVINVINYALDESREGTDRDSSKR